MVKAPARRAVLCMEEKAFESVGADRCILVSGIAIP